VPVCKKEVNILTIFMVVLNLPVIRSQSSQCGIME
jgi:hypothetical protein